MPRPATDKSVECKKPGCTRRTVKGYAGWCPPHAQALGVRHRLRSAEGLRQEITKALDRGDTINAIASRAGISGSTVRAIYTGSTAHCRKNTQERIQEAINQLKGKQVWAVRRRLRALRKLGFSVERLAAEIGISEYTVTEITLGRTNYVSTKVAEAVCEYYERHQHYPRGDVDRRVVGRYWAAPLDWEDIDDISEKPIIRRSLMLKKTS